ncbi:MAG: hypothetical protein QXE31_05875 [Candidatus Woesearchaeota archaeon]
MQLNIAFLLHAYQPWWQFPSVLEQITQESYNPIFSDLLNDERFKLTLNVNWSLVELFQHYNYNDLIALLEQLTKTKRIEFTGTSAYHAFMPLISDWMRNLQIDLQEKNMKDVFPSYNPNGFFLPEMGFSQELIPLLINRGYLWTITDDPPFIAHHNKNPPYNYLISPFSPLQDKQENPFVVFLRSKYWSFDRIANPFSNGFEIAKELKEQIKNWTNGNDAYLVIAMDLETFNHHKKGYWQFFMLNFLDALKQHPEIKLLTLSELYFLFEKKVEDIPKGSWSTSQEQYKQGNFYPLWKDTGFFKEPHNLLWQIYNLTEPYVIGNKEAELALAKAINSCTWWQIPLGNPHLSKFGADEMVRAAEISNNPHLSEIYEFREKLRQYKV